jgi:hypothetical protein
MFNHIGRLRGAITDERRMPRSATLGKQKNRSGDRTSVTLANSVRLIISDLENQLGLLGWHTTSATVSAAASTHAFALIHTERRIFYWILLIRPLEIGSCFDYF